MTDTVSAASPADSAAPSGPSPEASAQPEFDKAAEAAKAEAPKTEAPKTEAPKTEAPKTDAPK